ncbi:MAG TPA: glycosyltransferase family 39 protein [Bryobacteraceae bacterium]|nr:glycosyltransferase family 39 protein [Bryobacteraceae bacterium]
MSALLFTGLAAALQYRDGAYGAELGSYPDEPAHLITGLMIRDYVFSGMKIGPIDYGENYYLHYPKVGFGMWPPLFHFVEAAWFVLFPPSRTAAFVLEALITGLLAALLAGCAARLFGIWFGLMAGVCFVFLPVVRLFTGMIMADTLMALIAFVAMLAFAAYAEKGGYGRAALFGLFCGLAVATKSNAAALALLPPITIVLLRKYRMLIDPATFLAAAVALAIAIPCQLLVVHFWTGAVSPFKYSAGFLLEMLRIHLAMYVRLPGFVLLPLAIVGAAHRVILPYFSRTIEPLWGSVAGLVAAMFLFGFAPLPPEPRYHIAAMAAIILFACAGLYAIAARYPVLALAVAVLFVITAPAAPRHKNYGFMATAEAIEKNPAYRNSVMLVSSENFGEGMLIPEIALREQRPGHYVLRGTKVLSRSRWDLDSYELLYKTPEEIDKYLESIPVRLVIYDTSPGIAHMPHHVLLKQLLQTRTDKWRRIATYPNEAGGNVEVYEQQGAADHPGKIQVDMRYTLRTVLKDSYDGEK